MPWGRISKVKALRVAGVGAGYFSQFHLEAWSNMPEVEYVALCDADAAKAGAMAGRSVCGFSLWYSMR